MIFGMISVKDHVFCDFQSKLLLSAFLFLAMIVQHIFFLLQNSFSFLFLNMSIKVLDLNALLNVLLFLSIF